MKKCQCGKPATVKVTISGPGGTTTKYTCDAHEPRTIPGDASIVSAEPLR